MNDVTTRYQGYLVAQLVLGAIGFVVLAVADFGGFYYRAGSVDVYGSVYLGSGLVPTVLVLLGLGGLGLAGWAALDSLRDETATLETVAANARRSVRAGLFTAGLAVAGAVALAVANWGVTWWLDAGFWGAFAGGVFVAALGVLLRNAVEDELAAGPPP
jgi:hypothetical protein